jgi:hypothetical protein
VLANPENAKQVMADLVAGAPARLEGEAAWLSESGLPLSSDGEVVLAVSSAAVRRLQTGCSIIRKTSFWGSAANAARGARRLWRWRSNILRWPACRLLRSGSWRRLM